MFYSRHLDQNMLRSNALFFGKKLFWKKAIEEHSSGAYKPW